MAKLEEYMIGKGDWIGLIMADESVFAFVESVVEAGALLLHAAKRAITAKIKGFFMLKAIKVKKYAAA